MCFNSSRGFGQQRKICKLCGCLCLRAHSVILYEKQVVWSHCGAHTVFTYLLYSRRDGDGVPRLHARLHSLFLSERFAIKEPERVES